MNLWQDMQDELSRMAAEDLLRNPAVVDSACAAEIRVGGRAVVCLCSNDYLGLANDEHVKRAAVEAIGRFGVGAGASRLVSGTSSLHARLEERLAQFKGVPAAVTTSTGWMANQVAIHALVGPGDLILCDKLNHASILDAALSSGARLRTYGHRDVERLGGLLAKHRSEYRRCLVVTDSVFSMDGDVAPLAQLVALKKRYDAQLLIDEAHATGVLGDRGRGAAELLGVEGEIDATVGTLSKAIGAMGGFVAGPQVLIDTIRNAGRPFIYTTALPPAICAAAIEALEIIDTQPQRRQRLLEMAWRLRGELARIGLGEPLADGEIGTQILPVVIGVAAAAVELSRKLLEEGFFVPAIRPPTVPKGTSRLRVSLSANHRPEDLRRFVEALVKFQDAIK